MHLKGELPHSSSSLVQLLPDPSPGGGAWLPGTQIFSFWGVTWYMISAQGTAKANWGSRWRWAGNPVPKMSALIGTGETDGGRKRLSRKEVLGPGKMVVWEEGSEAHCPHCS